MAFEISPSGRGEVQLDLAGAAGADRDLALSEDGEARGVRLPSATVGTGTATVRLADGILNGAIAGAAGATGLNAATYLDMSVRGRSSSSAPEDTVEKLAEKASVRIPGDQESRANRVSGLGALNGIASGVVVGTALGALRAAGWRPGVLGATLTATLGAMALTDGVMSLVGVTDPRNWSTTDWASDVVPHLAYGFVTAVALDR